MSKKHLLTGNEAVARGAYEAGLVFASAYPGTPSTEILENIAEYNDSLYCEWAPNEKVALEAAIGASVAGGRALAAMKHVGVNVAADPLFTVAYTGVNGGLVLAAADDPGQHSSLLLLPLVCKVANPSEYKHRKILKQRNKQPHPPIRNDCSAVFEHTV